MAKYGISNEGVQSLNQLASDMSKLNDDIEKAGKTLKATISGYGDGLGIYEEKINDLVDCVNAAQEKGRESVEQLTEAIKKLAQTVQDLVSAGLGN